MRSHRIVIAIASFIALGGVSAWAQGTPTPPAGSPAATTTIPGDILPPFPQKFGGQIELNAAQSKPFWPARGVPPKGAPNVLLILIDDEGFGAPSTFGGVIPTPTLDKVAARAMSENR